MKRKIKIIIVLSMLVLTSITLAQFKTSYFPNLPDRKSYEDIDSLEEQGVEDGRFSHRQLLSASLSFYKGAPLSLYAYTNMFAYQVREDLRADIKIHGVFINPAYQDLWGPDLYLRPHMAMDAGVKYSPMNNRLFDIHARTYHGPSWNGQSVYLTLLGIPIKRLYTSKSFNDNKGPHFPGFLD